MQHIEIVGLVRRKSYLPVFFKSNTSDSEFRQVTIARIINGAAPDPRRHINLTSYIQIGKDKWSAASEQIDEIVADAINGNLGRLQADTKGAKDFCVIVHGVPSSDINHYKSAKPEIIPTPRCFSKFSKEFAALALSADVKGHVSRDRHDLVIPVHQKPLDGKPAVLLSACA